MHCTTPKLRKNLKALRNLKAGIVGLGQVGLLFEVDIIGERGRIRVPDNGEKIEYLTFKNDKRS